jgi:hypothetical protein
LTVLSAIARAAAISLRMTSGISCLACAIAS